MFDERNRVLNFKWIEIKYRHFFLKIDRGHNIVRKSFILIFKLVKKRNWKPFSKKRKKQKRLLIFQKKK
jgi:hypothetical protein